MSQRLGRLSGIVFFVATVFLACGCGGSGKLCRVTGTVKANGQPVPNLLVNFVPESGRPSWGLTDEAGAFKLVNDRDSEGAVSGKHKVYFTFKPYDAKQEIDIQKGKGAIPPEIKTILAKYGKLEKSTLTYEVAKDGQVIDINLN